MAQEQMNELGLDPAMLAAAARSLHNDAVGAEVARALAAEGIEVVVLKGPVLAEWLYAGELRRYGDLDLMVCPQSWKRAVAVLERLGFRDYLGPMRHPGMESFASTGFLRGRDSVDLHCAIHGLDGDMDAIWQTFSAGPRQTIGGQSLRVPPRAAVLLHVALHAMHHNGEGKSLEDLRRAARLAGEEEWRDALELARRHDGLAAFAAGLRLTDESAELASRLNVEDVRSSTQQIHAEGVPTAEALNALLAPEASLSTQLATILHELFPNPKFMRWRSPLARRGALGLLLSYPARWGWLMLNVPRGLLAVRRARRAQRARASHSG
jgi:hypothetical protein